MTEPKITREQIEEWRQEARYSHDDVMEVKFTPGELIDLCALALQALDMQPRPIEEAPTDGRLQIVYTAAAHGLSSFWGPCAYHPDAGWCTDGLREVTHFIPLSSLPEPRT